MKAPIDNLFGEHSYCDDFCARKDELKSSTYKPAVKIRNEKKQRCDNTTGRNKKTASCTM